MNAIQFSAETKKLNSVQIPVPKIVDPRDVLVKVAYSGVCGTDLHIIALEFPCIQTRPVTLGHEFSGTVVDFGSDITHLIKGDSVVVDPNNGCFTCNFCHQGRPNFCKTGRGRHCFMGTFSDGGWADYCLCASEQVHKIPEQVTLEQAALAEPLSCLAHGWDIVTPLTVGQKILVSGAGIIGALWVSVLHLHGHRRVTVSEPNPVRLEMIKKLETGFELVLPEELEKSRKTFDVVIDCSGACPAIELAVSLLKKGGKICLFGVAKPGAKIALPLHDLVTKELEISSVTINPYTMPKALGLIQAMSQRYLSYDRLGVQTFSLSQYAEALDALKSGQITKAMFKINYASN